MQGSILRFEQFELDVQSFELRKSGRVLKLEKLPMELLILLAEKQGQLVTRQQIILHLWGDNVFVDTRQGINTAIHKIRVVLRDDPEHPRLLQTVTGKGYRLMAPAITPDERSVEEPALQLPVPSSPQPPPIPAASLTNRVALVLEPQGPMRRRSVYIAAILGVSLASISIWLLMRAAMPHRQPATERRVTSNSLEAPIKWAIISRDGRYIAYTDPGGMYLRALATGETRRWKLPLDFVANPNSWFLDGTHLLAMRIEGSMKTPSLWKLSLFGGSPQKLIDNAGPGWVSPDGSRIAFLRVPDFGHELWVMGSDGSNPRRIAVTREPEGTGFRISQIFPITWSPDGRRIAYIERAMGPSPAPFEDARFSLRTCDASGGDVQVLLKDARLRPALSWPEKNRILFAYREDVANEYSDEGVRSIGVDPRSGIANGPIETITKGAGSIGGMSSTSDGKQLVLWRMNTQFQAYVAEFDQTTGKLKAPRRVTLDANGNVAEAWLPDSRTILFVSNRNGMWNLYKQAIDETTADLLAEGRSIFLPRLSADGSQILYESRADPEHFSTVSLMRLPLAGGPPKLVLQGEGILNYQCARLPSTLCLVSKQQGRDHVFSSFDSERGMGVEVLRISGGPYDWTLSPDGRTLAVFPGDHRIRRFSIENGAAHETKTITVNDWMIQQGDWSADGKVILMESYAANGRSVILQVDQAGKASVLLEGEANVEFWWMVPSPDGRYGIIEAKVPGDNNAWMLERY